MLDHNVRPRSHKAIAAGKQVLDVVVEHAEFKHVLDTALDLIETMRSLRLPSGLLLQAEPGMGKTLLLELISRRLSKAAADQSRGICLHIQLDSAVDTHRLAALVAQALGFPRLPTRQSLDNLNHMVAAGMERRRPCALLIDEAQHVCEGNRDLTARAVTDWLKVRMDQFNLPVICAGTQRLERLSVINQQFTSRASFDYALTPLVYGDGWRQLLGAFVESVDVADLSVISGPLARPIHAATAGNLRSLKKLLAYGAMRAAESAGGKLTSDHLRLAYEEARGQAQGAANPFVDLPKVRSAA